MPRYRDRPEEFLGRAAEYREAFRAESEHLHDSSPMNSSALRTSDSAVILSIILLLMTEGADYYLLLALLYILM